MMYMVHYSTRWLLQGSIDADIQVSQLSQELSVRVKSQESSQVNSSQESVCLHGEELTGVARAAAKLLVLAAASPCSSSPEQLAASALRLSYTRTYASPPATVNCQGRHGLQCMEFNDSGLACTKHRALQQRTVNSMTRIDVILVMGILQ